jgi:hypothetical protein
MLSLVNGVAPPPPVEPTKVVQRTDRGHAGAPVRLKFFHLRGSFHRIVRPLLIIAAGNARLLISPDGGRRRNAAFIRRSTVMRFENAVTRETADWIYSALSVLVHFAERDVRGRFRNAPQRR